MTLRLRALVLGATAASILRCSEMLAPSAVYDVGPGRPYTSIGAVPWESLNADDTVLIYWRADAYSEKWVLCRQGASNAPITVRGVAGPQGQLPVIDGNGATTRAALNYWNENRSILTGPSPGFLDEGRRVYFLATNSICRDAGAMLLPLVAPSNNVTRHFLLPRTSTLRPNADALDIGAYEFSPLEAWRRARFGTNFLNVLIAGDAADPDVDGANNLVEFACASDPLMSGSIPRIIPTIADGFLTLSYLRPEAAPLEISYVVDSSATLLTWCSGCTIPVSATGQSDNTARVVVRDSVPIASESPRFLRILVHRK